MPDVKLASAGIGLAAFVVWLNGCVAVAVPVTLAGAGEYYRYATTHVAQDTVMGNVDQVTTAGESALKKMNIRLASIRRGRDLTTMRAATPALDITIDIEPVTDRTTKITVDAARDRVRKDKSTATAILSQIRSELNRIYGLEQPRYRLFAENTCRHTIRVVARYQPGSGDNDSWQTQGWVFLNPGQRKYIVDTRNRYVYLYGETLEGGHTYWQGQHFHRFEDNRYGFFKMDMGAVLTDFTQSFSCNR
jgi:hypothetical protein